MNNKEVSQLRIDVDKLTEAFKELVDALRFSQVLFKGTESKYKYRIFISNVCVRNDFNCLENKLSKILDHLNIEFEWIECKPHYELKEKKEEE